MVRVSSCCCNCSLKTGTILIGVFYLGALLLPIMRHRTVRQCCCGCSLRTGSILIAVFYLVFYVPVLKSIVILGFDARRREEMLKSETIEGLGTEQKKVAINITYSCSLGALICVIVLNIMLAIGAILRNTILLFIWYIGNIIGILVMCVAVVVVPFSGTFDVYRKVGVSGALTVIVFLTIYFLMVVHSFYYEIKEERQRLQHTRMLEQQQQQQQQRDQPYRLQHQEQSTQQQHLQYQEQLCMQPLHLEQQHVEQQCHPQQQQQYYLPQQHYQQQQEQQIQQQPAYNSVTIFTVASCNPPDSTAPSAPPPW